jgi:hypothetical protein
MTNTIPFQFVTQGGPQDQGCDGAPDGQNRPQLNFAFGLVTLLFGLL